VCVAPQYGILATVSVPLLSVPVNVPTFGTLNVSVDPLRVNVLFSVYDFVDTTPPLVVEVANVAEYLPSELNFSVPPVTVVTAPFESVHWTAGVMDESVNWVDVTEVATRALPAFWMPVTVCSPEQAAATASTAAVARVVNVRDALRARGEQCIMVIPAPDLGKVKRMADAWSRHPTTRAGKTTDRRNGDKRGKNECCRRAREFCSRAPEQCPIFFTHRRGAVS
jgi:hypothetical protein